MQWDVVIGLEVHAQLKTESKLFSGSPTLFGAQPNTQASFIDVGLPGVLPVLNEEAVRLALLFGLAIEAQINDYSYFERKNYFYPDLPKGYQISQYQRPILQHGSLIIELDDQKKTVFIERAHLEEDAGKSIHDAHSDYTGIDLNRAGMPLLEIVTTPCLFSISEAIAYLKSLHQLLRFLDVCDGNMQEGSFRCDANISLKPKGTELLGVRTEIKNLNSFRFIEKALHYEQARQMDILETGGKVQQETRLFNPDSGHTELLRLKENEQDYRYFPDPDLLPISLHSFDIPKLKQELPLLPAVIKNELTQKKLSQDDIQFLLSDPALYRFFNKLCVNYQLEEKFVLNWLKGPYLALLNANQTDLKHAPLPLETFGIFLQAIIKGQLSTNLAKKMFPLLWQGETTLAKMITEENNAAPDDAALGPIIQQIIKSHPTQVKEFQNGKEKLLGFFMGHIMRVTKGRGEPEQIKQLLIDQLKKS